MLLTYLHILLCLHGINTRSISSSSLLDEEHLQLAQPTYVVGGTIATNICLKKHTGCHHLACQLLETYRMPQQQITAQMSIGGLLTTPPILPPFMFTGSEAG